MAFVRSARKVVVMIESAAGAISAAPRPCSPRKRISVFPRRREPVQERRDREDDDAHKEDPLAAHQVAGSSAEKQETAERQGVRVHDPLQVGVRHLQVCLDLRQRHVHDRGIEDDHELRHAHQHEH